MEVLIIRPGALGDTLMALPAIIDLRAKSQITFIGRQPGLEFLRDHVRRAFDLEGPGWHRLFMKNRPKEVLPVFQTDHAVAFFRDEDGLVKRNLKAYLPGTKVRVFPSLPLDGEDVHVAQFIAMCLMEAGLPVDPLRALTRPYKRALLKKTDPLCPPDKLLFHPGSGNPEKNYPPDLWLSLLLEARVESRFRDFSPVFLLGPADQALYPFFRDELSHHKIEILFCPDRERLMRALWEAALYVGHDSGITHLAALAGTPTLALFKATDVARWRPMGPHVKVIENQASARGLIREVLEAGREMLGG